MTTKQAELIFAVAAEREKRDIKGRKQAATALLEHTQKAALATGWNAMGFGTPPHQVTFFLQHQQTLTIMIDNDASLSWKLGPMHPSEGQVDCLTYNPVEKVFYGLKIDEGQIDAVEALATFITNTLK